jgi:hypothetical protein
MREGTYNKMLTILTAQQVDLLADMLVRVQERARDRRCEQRLEIIFNDKGIPRFINASDKVRLSPDQNADRESA